MSPVNVTSGSTWSLRSHEPWEIAAAWLRREQGFASWRDPDGTLRVMFATRGSALRWELGESVERVLCERESEEQIVARAWPPAYPSLVDWLLADPSGAAAGDRTDARSAGR